ncbi:unnamed protein product [Fraxinus pennsylvanica]|uniref:Response regulatory domain-containing protein n=1 Tax=Fraxinus pennsylvanica TaxID=56036 RepID=A0AAD2A994_9LAMI|nr:unnamed protein product [Fraxinus pennsylvanica]
MPLMNGIEATRRIREEEGNYGVHIQIIALTAHERGEEEINKMDEVAASKRQEVEAALEVVSVAIATVEEKQDYESLAAAYKANLHLQSLIAANIRDEYTLLEEEEIRRENA